MVEKNTSRLDVPLGYVWISISDDPIRNRFEIRVHRVGLFQNRLFEIEIHHFGFRIRTVQSRSRNENRSGFQQTNSIKIQSGSKIVDDEPRTPGIYGPKSQRLSVVLNRIYFAT